ncbi:hypothetical protein EMIT0P171_10093 [Pseudomonas sp. IT-P171]
MAHFLLSIPLLHTKFRYSGINIILECLPCIADLPCLKRVFFSLRLRLLPWALPRRRTASSTVCWPAGN